MVAILSVGFASCQKDKKKEPEITALINGRYWVSGTSTNYMQKVTPDNNPPYTQITIAAYTADYRSTLNFTITDYNDYGQGDCLRLATFTPAGAATDTVMWMGVPVKSVATLQYVNGSESFAANYDGELTIGACSDAEKIISGTFSFVGVSSNGDTVRVTEGKIIELEFGKI